MKGLKFKISLYFCLLTIGVAHSEILRVNNVATLVDGVGGYVTLAAAVNAAEPGDTIHIEGSVTPYTGNVSINKKLVIIGPGYFLRNTPETQYYKESAKIDFNITFEAGSEGSVLAGVEHRTGTVAGQLFQINNTAYTGNKVTIQTNNISIISCKLFYIEIDVSQNRDNINVQKCFFNPGVITTSGSGAGVIANLSISNCFFRNDYTSRLVINSPVGTLSNWRISQCTFYNSFSVVAATSTNFSFNAFYGTGTVTSSSSNDYNNNVMNANVSPGSITDNVNGNVIRGEAVGQWFSQTGADVAVDIYFTAAGNTSACPLYDGGSQKGMYGGGMAYAASGMFNIPSVYDIQMDVEVGDSFDMTIRARTH